jgi:hypothetical protein
MENQNKRLFNKFAKMTIWSFVGSVLFFLIASYSINLDILWNIVLFASRPWVFPEIIFSVFYYASAILLILTPILGVTALLQIRSNKESGSLITLLLTAVSIIYIISQILILI